MRKPVLPSPLLFAVLGLSLALKETPADDSLRFTRKLLTVDPGEACAVVDVNNDGKVDVLAGRNWYAAPDFVPRPIRVIEEQRGYLLNNGEHAHDVNGDGRVDVISGDFFSSEVYWYENPGGRELRTGQLWKKHLLVDTKAKQNEITFLRDLDGDGTPEWVVNSWRKESPTLAWRMARDSKAAPTLEKIVIGSAGNGHGMGFGDINGDGREDILVGTGWYERPSGDPFAREWRFHADWTLHASCPMIVVDLDRDGRNDIIWSLGHDYGLYWWQQLGPDASGKILWKEHLIDKSYSQAHALDWVDLDGDGEEELVTGKRKYAHNGNDPGGQEPPCLYYYTWNRRSLTFTRHVIDEGHAGTGLQIRAADMNGNGRTDIVVAGKSGTYILFNEGLRTELQAGTPKLVSVRKIWDGAAHNAFTDLIHFQGNWFCTFREADKHAGGQDGTIRVIVSEDGETWNSAGLLVEEGIDLRDPKLCTTPDGRLMLVAGGSVYDGSRYLTRRPRVAFSRDGRKWTTPQPILAEDHWAWRITWHEGRAYAVSKLGEGSGPRRGFLYRSADGVRWEWVAELDVPGVSETTLRFLPTGEMLALVRREAGNKHGWIGSSKPPYKEWIWQETGYRLGGPNFIRLPDGSLWAAARRYHPDGARTVLAEMTRESYRPVLTLPSGGDTSYPGLVWHEDLLWMSYYSSHEGKTSIYLARIQIVP